MKSEERKSDLMHRIMELAAEHGFEEIREMITTVEKYKKDGTFVIAHKTLSNH